MFRRHLIRLLKKSTFTSAKTHKISSLPILSYFSDSSSLKYLATHSQFNSLCGRTFSSDSKVETEIQSKDAKLPDADDIPYESNTQKPVSSGIETQASSEVEAQASSEVETQASSFNDENTSADLKTEGQGEFRFSTIYMRGLPYTVTKEEIMQFFDPLGIKPTKVILRADRFGFTNGKAEVEFETSDEAAKAMKKQNHYIGNRYIELSMEPFPQMNADRMVFRQRGYEDFKDPFYSENSEGYTVKLGGLPYEATAEDIHKFFENLNIKPIEINLKYSTSGQPLGLCFVKFKAREEALEALKNNNEYMGNRYIKVTMMRSSQGRMQYSGGMYDDQRSFSRFDGGIKTFEG